MGAHPEAPLSGFTLAVVITAAVVVFVVALLALTRFLFRRIARAMEQEISARFSPSEIRLQDPMANFFGQTSRGVTQTRGNGALVLTGDRLWFMQAVPRRELSIDLATIEAVSTCRSHLGKTVGRDLLHVTWRTDTETDSAAWWVTNPHPWIDALNTTRAGSAPTP